MLQTLYYLKALGCFGCLSGLLGLLVAAICLVILLEVLGLSICDVWLIGERLCNLVQ